MATVRGTDVHRRIGARAALTCACAVAPATSCACLAMVAAALATQAVHVAAASSHRDKCHEDTAACLRRDADGTCDEMQTANWTALADDGYGDGGTGFLHPFTLPAVYAGAEHRRASGTRKWAICDGRDDVFVGASVFLRPTADCHQVLDQLALVVPRAILPAQSK